MLPTVAQFRYCRDFVFPFLFKELVESKSQTLRQNHTVLRRAALSGPERTPGSARWRGRGIYRLAFIRVQEPAATDYENQCMIPLTEKNVLSTKRQMPARLCKYTKFQIMPIHSKENVYFFFFWLYLAERKQKEIRKRAGWGGEALPCLFIASWKSEKEG